MPQRGIRQYEQLHHSYDGGRQTGAGNCRPTPLHRSFGCGQRESWAYPKRVRPTCCYCGNHDWGVGDVPEEKRHQSSPYFVCSLRGGNVDLKSSRDGTYSTPYALKVYG